jgi:predicted alpha/beta-hydrolase family hydrolase
METQSFLIPVSDSIGSVSAELMVPEKPIAVMTLAHGAGAGMKHRFMIALSKALAEKNIGTLRFNFPYMEQNKKRPDMPAVAEKTVGAAITALQKRYPTLPLFVSGKSFGGRMSSHYLSKNEIAGVKGIIFYGFPLHPAGNPSTDRAAHLKNIKLPMYFLQGTKDALATEELIKGVCKDLPTEKLEKIEGADHGFMISRKERIDILQEKTIAWIEKLKA